MISNKDNINFIDLSGTILSINELDMKQSPPVLYLNILGKNIKVTCPPWDNIRIDQTAFLLLNGDIIDTQAIQPLNPAGDDPQLGKAPVFSVDVAQNFTADNTYHMQLRVKDSAQNESLSQILTFVTKANALGADIKIDITQGAAGYSDQYPYLMPANIAVVRGPAGKELEARSQGVVRFQDVGGGKTCIFSFDDKGACPLTLIRIDSLHPSSQSASSRQSQNDRIIITERGKTDELKNEPVIFGEYVPVTDPAAAAVFKSVSSNTVGIADGKTMCIISIIANDATLNDKLYIKLDDGLTLAKETFNKLSLTQADIDLPYTKIVNGMAEFGVTTDSPGTYKVGYFPETNPSAYLTNTIVFKSLL